MNSTQIPNNGSHHSTPHWLVVVRLDSNMERRKYLARIERKEIFYKKYKVYRMEWNEMKCEPA